MNTDCLKSLKTDKFCTIESKFVNVSTMKNVSNFIFMRNYVLPIKIESADPR
jgi:hypothetical protein